MIHLVLGRQGSGKTLYMVSVGFSAWRAGRKVYSNIALRYPYEPLDYDRIVSCDYSDGVVLIDEVHQLLPARRSMRKASVAICDGFLSMARKKGLDVYGTTQISRKVDIRFREEADYVYMISRYAYENGVFREVLGTQRLKSHVPVIMKLECQESFTGAIVESYMPANPWYSLFDTHEIIKVRGLEE